MNHIHVCANCAETFHTRRLTSKYCSRECSIAQTGFKPGETNGRLNARYNGGWSATSEGRTLIVCRDYSIMLYSRALMCAAEGRLLRSDEIVHHVNGDKFDDRIENLAIVSRADHMRIHHAELRAAQNAAFAARKLAA